MKNRFNHSLSVRLLALTLSFLVGTQPIMASATANTKLDAKTRVTGEAAAVVEASVKGETPVKRPIAQQVSAPANVKAQVPGSVENPLYARFAFQTMMPFLLNRSNGNQLSPTTIARGLQAYCYKPEMRCNFLDLKVEENTHSLEILVSKQKKCVTSSGLVRTVYESLIINDLDTLRQKQEFIRKINPAAIDGALRQIALAEDQTLTLACERDEFHIPLDAHFIPADMSLVHSVCHENSTGYARAWSNLKFFTLRYPLVALAALYLPPAFIISDQFPKFKGFLEKEFGGKPDNRNVKDKFLERTDFNNKEQTEENCKKYYAYFGQNWNRLNQAMKNDDIESFKNQKKIMIEATQDIGAQLGVSANFSPSMWIEAAINAYRLNKEGNTSWNDWSYLKGKSAGFSAGIGYGVSLGLCAWSLYKTLSMFKDYQNNLVNVAISLKAAHGVYSYLQKNDLFNYLSPDEQQAFTQIFDKAQQNDTIRRLFSVLDTGTFKKPMTTFAQAGIPWNAARIGSAATLLGQAKKEIQQLFLAIGHVDYVSGLKKLITESEEQKNNDNEPLKFSLTEFVTDAQEPVLELRNAWYPLYKTAEAVPATLALGQKEQPHHLLITGVNGTGKSGVMLSTLNAVTMSMSHGIAPAEHARMTLFTHIYSHINMGDDQSNNASGFQNEVRHFAEIMQHIQVNNDANKEREKPEFLLFIHDESFRSTDTESAERLGWGLINFLNEDPYTISLCATHLNSLTVIEETTKGRFKNAYIETNLKDGADGYQEPIYTRKLKFGANKIRGMAIPIALDAIKNRGLLTPHIKKLFNAQPPRAAAAA